MTIAPLIDTDADDGADLLLTPWPRPSLQVVPAAGAAEVRSGGGKDAEGCWRSGRSGSWASKGASAHAVPLQEARIGMDVALRRAQRLAARRRRRRAVLGMLVAGLVCGLSLPLTALGGTPDGQRQGIASTGTVYVVRPGDTLRSIAVRFDHGGDPWPLAQVLAKETGSAVVVPGEHVPIP